MESQTIIAEIKKVFGTSVWSWYIEQRRISKIVFNNTEKLENLNSIVHPAVRKHFSAVV
jgi:dephospho-CoA kinase